MKRYIRIMLGKGSRFSNECYAGNFIGADFDIDQDLSEHLPDNFRVFNQEFIPIWLERNPGKSKISAGLSCGALWTISKGINIGDIVLCPNGEGIYNVGKITSAYYYQAGTNLPHRRSVQWLGVVIKKSSMSDSLRRSCGSIGTVSDITGYEAEIEALINEVIPQSVSPIANNIEPQAVVFALERHLEDFLVSNWSQTELGLEYEIYHDDEVFGRQLQTDVGILDILAISRDGSTLLVVELKRGEASDVVVGQILRYMGYVKEVLAQENQQVKGMIIGLEDDLRIRRALSVTNNIDFYRYEINFKLVKN